MDDVGIGVFEWIDVDIGVCLSGLMLTLVCLNG